MRVQVDTYNYAELMIIDFSSIIYTAGLTPDQRLSSEMTKSRSFSFHFRSLYFAGKAFRPLLSVKLSSR